LQLLASRVEPRRRFRLGRGAAWYQQCFGGAATGRERTDRQIRPNGIWQIRVAPEAGDQQVLELEQFVAELLRNGSNASSAQELLKNKTWSLAFMRARKVFLERCFPEKVLHGP